MNFPRRLETARNKGELSTADLQHWFGRPYPTVRSWVFDKREPRGFDGVRAAVLLDLLELCITHGKLKDLRGVSSHERPRLIRELREWAQRSRILKKDLAR